MTKRQERLKIIEESMIETVDRYAAKKGVSREKAFDDLEKDKNFLNWALKGSKAKQLSALIKKKHHSRKNKNERWLPAPYYGLDIMETKKNGQLTIQMRGRRAIIPEHN